MDDEESPSYYDGGGDADGELPETDRDKPSTSGARGPRPRTARPSGRRENRNLNNANETGPDGYGTSDRTYQTAGCSTFNDPNRPGTSSDWRYSQPRESRTYAERVSTEEQMIGRQAEYLLNMFLQDRAHNERNRFEPHIRDVCKADKAATMTGLTDDSLHDIATTLRRIGDDMSRDATLNQFIEQVPVQSTREVFMKVCMQMFQDGNFNWGRIVALFYFAYRLCVRSFMTGLDSMPWVKELLRWVVDFIVQHVAKWIISRGGWIMIKEWFGISDRTLTCLGVASALLVLWSLFKKD